MLIVRETKSQTDILCFVSSDLIRSSHTFPSDKALSVSFEFH
jgi:hypothetical protein